MLPHGVLSLLTDGGSLNSCYLNHQFDDSCGIEGLIVSFHAQSCQLIDYENNVCLHDSLNLSDCISSSTVNG